jgi:predicted MPP superfamily phosphohydrolase
MGAVFLFFWIALSLELIGAVAATTGALNPAGHAATGSRTFFLAVALTLGVAVYGFFAARVPRVERVALTSAKLSAGRAPLRIALLSDVHLGALVGAERLRRILARVVALKPDIVLSAGDLVDGQADHLNRLAPALAALRPPLGKFAVIGNHECYVGLAHALEFHARAGFTVLRGAAVEVTPDLGIAGVDDPAAVRPRAPAATDERAPLAALAAGRFVILLKHQPVVAASSAGHFDLQLSGHLHKGQIFPFGLFVRLMYAARTGLTALASGGWLYVSRGTGTWGPPMRVLAPPEITLIEIAPAR